jgi:NDP-sugar pyrophosphorylase family protein
MAGGLGSRLRPLTNEIPKPLIRVGSKPILQIILEELIKQGFYNFFFAVNYKAELIKSFFGNGARWGVTIQYLEENEQLGTAGALSLLINRPNKPLIILNADILTKNDFRNMLHFHNTKKNTATMGVREYSLQIPYGVVEVNDSAILNIVEKPIHYFYVNAGIYIIEPKCLDYVIEKKFIDMTDLFQKFMSEKLKVGAYTIYEYWLDIGLLNDLEKAQRDYEKEFT